MLVRFSMLCSGTSNVTSVNALSIRKNKEAFICVPLREFLFMNINCITKIAPFN